MVKKPQVRFVCSNCGAVSSNWAGRCSQCAQWNTLVEEVVLAEAKAGALVSGRLLMAEPITAALRQSNPRLVTGISEVDNVLGGGLVAGSLLLLTGQPGVGKSTLLMQLAQKLAERDTVLYVSGEESANQVSLRAERLGSSAEGLQLAISTSADDVAATITEKRYGLVIVDSIQTMTAAGVGSAAGSISQITASAQVIMAAAKARATAVVMVGHVTKEGSVAGPKVLEHIVDVVLSFEGESNSGLKVLRSQKNRFGGVDEVGIFEMTDSGLKVIDNPSAALLAERQASSGSIILAAMEGSRALLVEVQALVNPTSYGYPKRTASGLDQNRLNLLIAMLERRTKLRLSDQDIYLNIVGGIRITEPAADLAVCLAIGSAAKGRMLLDNAVVFGEVGLSGEVRRVPYVDRRLREAQKLGFRSAIGPQMRDSRLRKGYNAVSDVRSALNQFLVKP